MEVHAVSKIDNARHATFTVQIQSSPAVQLAPSSIRVRTLFISLTSNNLSYARGGHFLHWWDTYPLPTACPAPYNDVASWGIVPAWGYAIITKSTTSIPEGAVLWGFWPTSTVPTDLRLKATEPKGHWIEISETRQKLMSTYNRYIEVPRSPDTSSSPDFGGDEIEHMAWNALFRGVWEGAYLLSQYVFSPKFQTQAPIHPLGMGMNWTARDADLASAVIVSFSASSKTARSFAYHLFQRPAAGRPLGLVQVTSLPNPILKAAESSPSSFPTKTVAYNELHECLNWMAELQASKIVIVDFGARANSLGQLLELINKHAALRSLKVVIIQVGSQQKVYTNEEQLAAKEAMSKLGKVQYNTSGVQDAVMQANGAEAYFDKLAHVWDEWYRTRHASIPDMRIVWGAGMSGANGLEGGWEKLCKSQVGGSEGLVYRL